MARTSGSGGSTRGTSTRAGAGSRAAAQAGDGLVLGGDEIARIQDGYATSGLALEMGALVNGDALAEVPVRIPVAMTNRHGLIAGATGTGKTTTLQLLAEQLSDAGVPVFAADVKGDLSGLASPGRSSEKLAQRCEEIGQDWMPVASPVEFFALGGIGAGVPVRASVERFGSVLLAKVLGLNATQESSLGLVFHYAAREGLPLVDLGDLRSVLQYLTSAEGKAELAGLGGLSSATVGVILRELIMFSDQGADVFFGVPEIDTAEFLRTDRDGRGMISLLELPAVQDKPELYSTFLMWLLAELFGELPEVGDTEKPKLVFFFDEAHLLFRDASKEFLQVVTQTVRLIRSKGVGVFFVTQTPKDVPDEVLAQLGSRIQHQLRAHTPNDAKALRATVSTYPNSGYDLAEVLTTLATGEAIVTVMSERGAPTPVAWTRLRAPRSSMDPTPAAEVRAAVQQSPLLARYGVARDPRSARDIVVERRAAHAAAASEEAAIAAAKADRDREVAELEKRVAAEERAEAAAAKKAAAAEQKRRAAERAAERKAAAEQKKKAASHLRKGTTVSSSRHRSTRRRPGAVSQARTATKVARVIVGALFGSAKRRR